MRSGPTRSFEEQAERSGARRVAGIDEAGRGPLAGSVVAAAVILSPGIHIKNLNDSKLLSPLVREKLFTEIMSKAESVGVGIVSHKTIDEINILQATRLAMKRAVESISPPPDFLLIDGPISLETAVTQMSIVKGDSLSVSISAAAIIAKVTRDRMMVDLHRQYPIYGFDRHKGYPTRRHLQAIRDYGPCPIHRKTFKGVLISPKEVF
jgi:ribonuclease HII